MHRLAAIVASLGLLGPRLTAQTCDATAAPDSVPASLIARFTAALDRDSVALDDADSLGVQLHAVLQLPDPMPIPAWTPSTGRTVPSIRGDYELTIDRDGTIHDVRVARSSLVGAIDTGVVAALRTVKVAPGAEPYHLIMHVSVKTQPATTEFVDTVIVAPGLDTTRHARPSNIITLVDFTHPVPVWPGERELPAIAYIGKKPDAALSLTGTILLTAVINEKGKVLRGSVYHDAPLNASTFDIARMMAERYEFKPFTINGCAVKLYMIMPLMFSEPKK
jgi:hypothetical protein